MTPQRVPYPFEVYNQPGTILYPIDDTFDVFVFIENAMTIVQYPRHWYLFQCEIWAKANGFPEPEYFGGTQEGCYMAAPWQSWCGNILGRPHTP